MTGWPTRLTIAPLLRRPRAIEATGGYCRRRDRSGYIRNTSVRAWGQLGTGGRWQAFSSSSRPRQTVTSGSTSWKMSIKPAQTAHSIVVSLNVPRISPRISHYREQFAKNDALGRAIAIV